MPPLAPLDKIVLFGDSITELSSNQEFGFSLAPALQDEYLRRLQVITHGYGGYNTEHGRHLLNPILDVEIAGGHRIRLLIIFFGANDAADVSNTQQHVPVERYAENLEFLVSKTQSRNIPVILVAPAIASIGEGKRSGLSLRSQVYSEAACGVAEALDVPIVNLWKAFSHQQQPSDLFTDGVHLNGQGYKVWFELLLQTIRVRYPALRSENLPCVLPGIFDIDKDNLPESLWQPPVA
ncbi:Isoamyl acetate-hydrolyzing esterase [Penicillium rolfsii]|nr:Isoamyl acetate-hydrolyzing esterase [Penicillium rolfsii]